MPPVSYFVERIPPPPKEGDAADLSDLEYVLAVQATATPEQIAHAKMTAKLDPFEIFSEVLGPEFLKLHLALACVLLFFLAMKMTGWLCDENVTKPLLPVAGSLAISGLT